MTPTDAYTQLLAATISHLESLKNRGTRFVSVSPENLAALAKTTPRRAAPVTVAPATTEVVAPSTGRMPILLSPVATAPVSEAKAAAYAELRARALACVKCPHLASSRKNVVFGVGSPDASLMFVGEA